MMKRVLKGAAALLCLTFASSVPLAHADDWPQFLGPNKDCISQEKGLATQWPAEGPKRLWQFEVGEGFSCLAISAGRLFTMGQAEGAQWVYALDAEKGNLLWKVQSGKKYDNYPGPRATPVVDADRVYTLDTDGHLMCLNAADGKIVWECQTLQEFKAKNLTWGVANTPLVDGAQLIVNVGQSQGSSVVSFDKMTGKVLWKAHNDMAGYASPTIRTIGGKRQLIVFFATGVVGMEPEGGKELWRIPWKTQFDIHATTPVVKDNLIFIASDYGTGCALIEVDLAKQPAAKILLKSKDIQAKYTTPLLVGDYLYAFDEQQGFRCVELKTLTTKWVEKGFNNGTAVMAGGQVYLLGEQGSLALAKVSPEKLEIVSKVENFFQKDEFGKELRCWTMPVVANGKLYARNEKTLICADVKGQ
ncbi:MAG TPA: PQQ-like beta-propeller repeat protein [Candidatus Sumerlaeota bacterium]|nr:PQQ-like beta-propeller repeat protein [Candidatus Sumerlaeota bacterium]